MFCKKCGKQIKDETLFCTNCGMKVTMPQAEINASQERVVVPTSIEREKPKAKGPMQATSKSEVQKLHNLTIVIGVLIVIIVALVCIIFFSKSGKKEHEAPQGYEETMADLKDEPEEIIPPIEEPEPDEEPVQEEPTAEPEPEEPVSQYFLPESDARYLTMEELEGFTEADCRIVRNELYARHGRRFNDENLQAYFDSCEWYHGIVAPEDFDESVLNEFELANRDLIVQYENMLAAGHVTGTATFSAYGPQIIKFELEDGVLTYAAYKGEEYGWDDIKEPFVICYPVSESCVWERGYPGYTFGTGSPTGYEELSEGIRNYRDRYDSRWEVSSPLNINVEVTNGEIVKVYTIEP